MEADALLAPLLLVKIGLYSSALIAGGLALHGALGIVECARLAPIRRLAAMAAGSALLFGGVRLLLINAQLGAGVADALNSANFAWTWRMQGPAATALAAGALALLISVLVHSRILMGLGALGFAACFALTGHTQALEPPGVAPWAVAAHTFIAAFWFAAPITLWPRADLTNDALHARMQRFSAFAVAAIPIMMALGLWLVWRLTGGLSAAFSSLYGQLLLAKFFAASSALGIGAFNKLSVAKTLQVSPERGRRVLARTLTLDSLLFASALGLVAWAATMTGPPDL